MKTLSKGGKIGLAQGKIVINIFLFLFPLVNLFSQTTLNNFGVSDYLNTHSGYTKFNFLDYNMDGNQDLILFGNQQKSFVIHKGLGEDKFSGPIRKFFFFPIDDLKWLTKSKRGDDYYIFVSRNRRLAGLVSFTKSYSLQLLNTVNFNSYPSSIEITDLDDDGSNEALIYGNNFDGIIQLKNDGYFLISDTLHKQNVFSEVEAFDFNQDDVQDLIAINVLNNTIEFLENTEIGGFYSTRKIEFEETLASSSLVDINNDNFRDLIISKEGGLEILYGDSVFSYSNAENIDLLFTPDKFIFHDFNKDENIDLLLTNTLDSEFSILPEIFNGENDISYPFEGIADINLYGDSTNSILGLLSKKGKFQFFKDSINWNENFNYSFVGIPDKIINFRLSDSSYSNLIISDRAANNISLLNLDTNGIFKSISRYMPLNDFSQFLFCPAENKLICFSNHNRLLEVLSGNNNLEFSTSRYLYATNPVYQLRIDRDQNFQILELDSTNLYHETISTSDDNYKSEKIEFIDSLVTEAEIIGDKEIYYWKIFDNEYRFIHSNDGSKNILIKIVADSLNSSTIILKDRTKGSKKILTIYQSDQKLEIYNLDGALVKRYKLDIQKLVDPSYINGYMQYYSSVMSGSILFTYDSDLNRIQMFSLDIANEKLILTNTIDGIQLNDYFVSQYFGNDYLVYTNSENNSISFKVLN